MKEVVQVVLDIGDGAGLVVGSQKRWLIEMSLVGEIYSREDVGNEQVDNGF